MNPLYGNPMPSGSSMISSAAPMYNAAPANPVNTGSFYNSSLSVTPSVPANPSMPAPRGGMGKNGFGVHPDVTYEQIADFLLPKFRSVESSHDYTNYIGKDKKISYNPSKSASGAYGYTNSTWNNYGGFPRAMDAPPDIQDKRMREDLLASAHKFQGDPFKIGVHHYSPNMASDPTKWDTPPTDKYGQPIPNALTPRQYLHRLLPPDRVDRYISAAAPSQALASTRNK